MDPNIVNLPPLQLPPGRSIGSRRNAPRVQMFIGSSDIYEQFSEPRTPPGTWNPTTELSRLRYDELSQKFIEDRAERRRRRDQRERTRKEKEAKNISIMSADLDKELRNLDQRKNRQEITEEEYLKLKSQIEKKQRKLRGEPSEPKPPPKKDRKPPPGGGGSGFSGGLMAFSGPIRTLR